MMNLMLSLLAGTAIPPASAATPPSPTGVVAKSAAPPGVVTRARPINSLPTLFSTDDYPLDAIRKEESGTASVTVAIGRDGYVANCAIETSSGSVSLDQTTCRILQSRARFHPALDANGRPIEDHSTARIRWQLPEPEPKRFADQRHALVFTANARGVTECRVETLAKLTDDSFCQTMMADLSEIAESLKRAALTRRELVLEDGILIGGPEVAKNVGRARGETLELMDAYAIAIDAQGAVSRCDFVGDDMRGLDTSEACSYIARTKFAPLDRAASDRSDRHAVVYWANYTRPIR